ncbi:hypothetical protein ACH5RR_038007 [Cinchona calisaya]|uniref:Uncharacterized protein n=1 Tax=Cinchona calisaya TaxID=153742 RepID=A0ABD2Y957_9GENT
MGKNLGGTRHNTNVRRRSSSKQDSEVGLAASIMNFMKQGFLLCNNSTTDQKRRKRVSHSHQSQQQEKKHHLLKNKEIEFVTLEEWILSSPCLNVANNNQGNDHQLSKQSSKRVHPSFDTTHQEVGKKEVEDSSFCSQSQSGNKLKKKVSFRLPEVADVFILDSLE